MHKLKILSLFSGIGAFEKALKRRNIPFELVGFSEIDKYAVKSYCAIHDVSENKNLGDITKIDEKKLPNDIDLITYGFPCQDISLAGNQKGLFNEDGSQTRSGLFFDALRIIEHTRPKIAIAENVKNLTSKKFRSQFQIVLESLEKAGYSNYWQILNSKDFGIPQNRERVFIVSVRKDIDQGFEFPESILLTLKLKDVLEDEVDEKFYLTTHTLEAFQKHRERHEKKGNGFGYRGPCDLDGVAKTLATRENRSGDNFIEVKDLGIRRLIPKEYFRLMGFDDEDFYKAAAVNSNAQLYKQAGNSIVVNVIEKLLCKLEETQKWLVGMEEEE